MATGLIAQNVDTVSGEINCLLVCGELCMRYFAEQNDTVADCSRVRSPYAPTAM